MADRKFTWFTDPKGDQRTNNLISLQLDKVDECPNMLCEDGEKRNLRRWCSHEELKNFQRIADANRYSYAIYVREGDYGPIRPWPFVKQEKYRFKRRRKISLKLLMEEAALASDP